MTDGAARLPADPSAAGRDATRGGGEEPFLTAAAVAQMVGGRVLGVAAEDGTAERVRVRRMAPLHRAAADDVTFLASARYADLLASTRAAVVLVAPELADVPGAPEAVRIEVARPHEAMLRVLPALHPEAPRRPGIHPTAVLGRGVRLGADVAVGPYAVVEDGAVLGDRVTVGPHCVLGPGVSIDDDSRLVAHVVLYAGTQVGRRVIVHAGARLGSDGFGYVHGDGQHRKIPHVGRCIIADDVEIGANTTVDRGSIDDTIVGAGTKIDNLVHLGHNVRVGRLCLIMAQVGVAGSASIEDGVVLAGQAGIGGHLTVGRGARIGGQGGVVSSVPAGADYSGYPARPHKEAMRAYAALFRLSGLVRRIEALLAREDGARAAATDGAAR